MIHKIIQTMNKNIVLLLAILWICLMLFPWMLLLDGSPWLRLGLAIILFCTPGMIISLLLVESRLSLLSHFTVGLVISMLMVSVLGVLGRAFHLPFAYIKPVFIVVGLIVFFILMKRPRLERKWLKSIKLSKKTIILFLAMVFLGIIAATNKRFDGDDVSYLAYLTNWQHAQPLDFREVVSGAKNMDNIRFWLAMFPMNLAFLSEISNLHGLLLIGYYAGPFFITIAFLSLYNLYEDLLPAGDFPIMALLLHFCILLLLQNDRQSGEVFFDRLPEDKVFAAFVIAPVFFVAIRTLLANITPRTVTLTLLCGFSLSLIHPVILAYSIFISGVYATIVLFINKDYKKMGIMIPILLLMVVPHGLLRFAPLASQSAFDLETVMKHASPDSNGPLISYIAKTPFYGFNLERIKFMGDTPYLGSLLSKIFSRSYLWILIAGLLWSLFNLKKNRSAPFIAATSLLVLLCATPYTGWLVGYFVSPRQLWRSPWLMPIGLVSLTLLMEALKFTIQKLSATTKFKIPERQAIISITLIISTILISYSYLTQYKSIETSISKLNGYRTKLESLVTLGNYLETNMDANSVFVSNVGLMEYLPGISSKTKVIFFRNSAYSAFYIKNPLSKAELHVLQTVNPSVSIQRRIAIIKDKSIEYILINQPPIGKYYAQYPQFFSMEQVNNFWLAKFRKVKQ